jgi:toxin ParE1/3/4
MLYRVLFTPEAEAQLADVYSYIAEASSPAVAQRFTDAVIAYCKGFSVHPRRGTRRDDLRPGLRTVGFRRRVTIAFAIEDTTVIIAGIFYGGQEFEAALRADEST